MENFWWIAAFISCMFFGALVYLNQSYKLKSSLFIVYKGIGTILVLLPLISYFPAIRSPYFYLFAVIQGLLCAYFENRFLQAVKQYGIEMASAIQPISICITFIAWLLMTPTEIREIAQHPTYFIIIILCLRGIVFSILQLRKSKIGFQAFVSLMPCLFIVALIDILNKKILNIGDNNIYSAIYYYILIVNAIMGLANLFAYIRKDKVSDIFKFKNFKGALCLFVLALIAQIGRNVAIFEVSNPSYAVAIIYTYPMLIVGGNLLYMRSHRSFLYPKISVKIIGILAISIIGLIIFAK